MAYIRLSDQQYPIFDHTIRGEHPATSFPDVISEDIAQAFGYAEVHPVAPPTYNVTTHRLKEAAPAESDGAYTQVWIVEPLTPEQSASNKAAVQAAKWHAIKAKRDFIKENGVKVGADWFHSDTFSRTQQLGLVMMGANIPADLNWKTMDSTYVVMTQALAGQIFQAVAASDSAVHGVAEQKRLAMLAMDDPTDFDVESGWPETHV